MRWFFATQKATRRLLNSHQYNFHGGSRSQYFQNKPIELPCDGVSTKLQSSFLFSTSHHLRKLEEENRGRKLDVQIVSKETVKPSSPTPRHLQTFNLSIIDQLLFDCYNPFILFIPNHDKGSVNDVIMKRSKHLKETLSETLTRYYPFAGEIKDNLRIECNDNGVDFLEARVNLSLEEFLRQPDDEKVRELIPKEESSLTKKVASVQVNIFDCGGIALTANLSHKIVDGYTYFLFINAWAATARGSSEKLSPSFVGSELFPNNPSLTYSIPSKLRTTKPVTTKRFVFRSPAIATLKAQPVATQSPPSHGPTRTEATGALIWKVAAKAAATVRPFGPQSPHILSMAVNLRTRASPPLPKESIGNLLTSAAGICFPDSQPGLPSLMGQMRDSVSKINSDFVDAMKGEHGHHTWNEALKMMNGLFDTIDEGDFLQFSSILNSGVWEIDFGWGKPVWFYFVNPGQSRLVTLNDTLKGGGVEAIVSLSPEEMKVFEHDPEILSYTTMDPSPLEVLD